MKIEEVTPAVAEYKITIDQDQLEHLANLLYIGTNVDDITETTYIAYDGDSGVARKAKADAAQFYNDLYELLTDHDESTFQKSFEGYEHL